MCGNVDIGALREDVDARLVSRIITYRYGIDGLLRTRDGTACAHAGGTNYVGAMPETCGPSPGHPELAAA